MLAKFNDGGLEGKVDGVRHRWGSEVTSLVMYRLAICWDFVFCRVYMVLYTKLSVVYAVSWKYLLCILCIVKVLWIVYCKGIMYCVL